MFGRRKRVGAMQGCAISKMHLVISVIFASAAPVGARAEVLRLETMAKGHLAVLSADVKRFAGAISSLTWNGMEFLDSTDHGRELQSDMSFDDLGSCYNPTEAGSQWDSRGPKSSSRVLSAEVAGGILHTKVDAAFWLHPGTPAAQREGCGWGARPDKTSAVNTTVTGGYLIEKQVRFGAGEKSNSLDYSVSFTVPHPSEKGALEIVAAYLPDKFERIYVFDATRGRAAEEVGNEAYKYVNGPLIFSTKDQKYALGVFCHSDYVKYIYHRFTQAGVVMGNCRNVVAGVVPNVYAYHAKIGFGTFADVVETMRNSVLPNEAEIFSYSRRHGAE